MANSESDIVVTPRGPGSVVRQGFEGMEMEVRDTASVAVAEREKAAIQAMFLMAQRRPRDWDNVRVKLMKDAERWGFADAAIWELPRGGKTLSGPSIRFAEAAIRAMGNIYIDMQVTLDSREVRKVQVVIIDLENMVRFAREVAIDKTVERKQLPKNFDVAQVIATRQNTYGERLYIVPATEDEVVQKQAVQVSKVIRTEGLRLLPADILDDVMAACEATFAKGLKEDPEKGRKQLADGFAKLNVLPEHLSAYLGHPLAQTSPAELAKLRGIWQAISQGETTWSQVMGSKAAELEANTKAPDVKSAPAAKADPVKQEPTAKADPHNIQTGEVLDPNSPDGIAFGFESRMKAAAAAGDEQLLKAIAADVANLKPPLPTDLAMQLTVVYTEAKKLLKEKKGGAAS